MTVNPFLTFAKLRPAARSALTASAAALAMLSLLGVFGALWPVADLVNQLAPLWVAAALIGAGLSFVILPAGKRRHAVQGAFAATIVLQGALIVPEVLSAPPTAPAAGGPEISLITFNVWDRHGRSYQESIAYLAASGADVVVMIEANGDFMDEARPALNPLYPYRSQCISRPYCRVYIYSKLPFAERQMSVGFPAFMRAAANEFRLSDAPDAPRFRLIAAHLARPRPAAQQIEQYDTILQELDGGDRAATILAGDLNTAPWSFRLRRFDHQSGLTRITRAMPTWPARRFTRLRIPPLFAFAPIDHVYVGENWRVAEIRRGPNVGSDHYPVEARLIWAPR